MRKLNMKLLRALTPLCILKNSMKQQMLNGLISLNFM
jgi:hypothetical protein